MQQHATTCNNMQQNATTCNNNNNSNNTYIMHHTAFHIRSACMVYDARCSTTMKSYHITSHTVPHHAHHISLHHALDKASIMFHIASQHVRHMASNDIALHRIQTYPITLQRIKTWNTHHLYTRHITSHQHTCHNNITLHHTTSSHHIHHIHQLKSTQISSTHITSTHISSHTWHKSHQRTTSYISQSIIHNSSRRITWHRTKPSHHSASHCITSHCMAWYNDLTLDSNNSYHSY
jgi:hypothetical protein